VSVHPPGDVQDGDEIAKGVPQGSRVAKEVADAELVVGTPYDRDRLPLGGSRADRIGATDGLAPAGPFHQSDASRVGAERLAAPRREDHTVGIGQEGDDVARRELPRDLIEQRVLLPEDVVDAISPRDEIGAACTLGVPVGVRCEAQTRDPRPARQDGVLVQRVGRDLPAVETLHQSAARRAEEEHAHSFPRVAGSVIRSFASGEAIRRGASWCDVQHPFTSTRNSHATPEHAGSRDFGSVREGRSSGADVALATLVRTEHGVSNNRLDQEGRTS